MRTLMGTRGTCLRGDRCGQEGLSILTQSHRTFLYTITHSRLLGTAETRSWGARGDMRPGEKGLSPFASSPCHLKPKLPKLVRFS